MGKSFLKLRYAECSSSQFFYIVALCINCTYICDRVSVTIFKTNYYCFVISKKLCLFVYFNITVHQNVLVRNGDGFLKKNQVKKSGIKCVYL